LERSGVRSDLLKKSLERSGVRSDLPEKSVERSGFGAKFDVFVNSIEKFFKEYFLC